MKRPIATATAMLLCSAVACSSNDRSAVDKGAVGGAPSGGGGEPGSGGTTQLAKGGAAAGGVSTSATGGSINRGGSSNADGQGGGTGILQGGSPNSGGSAPGATNANGGLANAGGRSMGGTTIGGAAKGGAGAGGQPVGGSGGTAAGGSSATAQRGNPFLPAWEYIPDGEPRVFGDRVYLYGSHDRAGSQSYCDYELRVWSAPLSNLTEWYDHGVSFSTRDIDGHIDDVPWSNNQLYAPDVVEKGGKYYLYAYIVGAAQAVGVSDTPGGPFKLLSKVNAPAGTPGGGQYIDPGVLVDDNGKVYIYWGYKSSHMAELNPTNMYEILPNTYQADIIPTTPPFQFFEAASPRKINGTYYLIYADGGKLAYATSKSPKGPFSYGGIIIQQGNGAPGGNIHGSLAKLNGQWYVFYHRMSHNTLFSRRACAERITIEPDGSIKEVEQTSLGFLDRLDPYRETSADIASVLGGGNYVTEVDRDTHPIINNKAGSVIGYKYFDFGQPATGETMALFAQIRDGAVAGKMEVWLDSSDPSKGTKIGTVDIGHQTAGPWRAVSTSVGNASGRHAVYFKFSGTGGNAIICDLKSFHFRKSKS